MCFMEVRADDHSIFSASKYMNLYKKKMVKYGSLTQDRIEIRTELIVNSKLLKCLKCLETMNLF